MNKYIIEILIVLFVAILSVNSVSAWGNTFECEGFNLEMPDGVEVANGYSPSAPPNHVELVEDLDDDINWGFINLDLSEVPLEKLPDCINIAENHTEDDLTIVKGQVTDDISYHFFKGNNITYAEFDKEGKHFYLAINHNCRTDAINLTKDIELIKDIKESIKLK